MDDFRRPFEYFEEKGIGGILLVLFFMLIAVEPLIGIGVAFFGYNNIENIFGNIFMWLAILYALFALFSGILLKKISRIAVKFTKIFLIFRLVLLPVYLCIDLNMQIKGIQHYKNTNPTTYEEMYGNIIMMFILCLLYAVVFSVGWYAYLCKSKKVGDLFMNKDAEALRS